MPPTRCCNFLRLSGNVSGKTRGGEDRGEEEEDEDRRMVKFLEERCKISEVQQFSNFLKVA